MGVSAAIVVIASLAMASSSLFLLGVWPIWMSIGAPLITIVVAAGVLGTGILINRAYFTQTRPDSAVGDKLIALEPK